MFASLWPWLAVLGILALAGCEPNAGSPSSPAGIQIAAANQADDVLRQVTAVPDSMVLINPLSTFTPIPTVTRLAEQTATPAATPTLAATPTPSPTPTVPPTPNPPQYSSPPLPSLPSILLTPTISRSVRVPILMYHYISVPPGDADQYRINLSVEPEVFRQQMAFLKSQGYETIDMYDLLDAILNGRQLPDKPIILTFDDGYRDAYLNAYPILTEFGYTGTFFISTEFVDRGLEPYMTWPMIEEMAAAGHRFESHGRSHLDLAKLGRADLIWQILGSQETLAAHIGYKPHFLSYPSGSYNDQTIAMVQELSFWGAVTTQGGSWHGFHNRFEWPRIRVSNGTSIERLQKALLPLPTAVPPPAGTSIP